MTTPPGASDLTWPTSMDGASTLFGDPVNLVEFTLNGAIDNTAVSFVVNDSSNYIGNMEVPVFLRFSTGEIVYAEAADAASDTFSTVERGVGSTSPTSHADGEVIRFIPVAEYFIQYKAAIMKIQDTIGLDPQGSLSDLVTRLAVSLEDDGALKNVGITDDDMVQIDGSPNDDEIPRFTANGIEGLTYVEFVTAITDALATAVGAMFTGNTQTGITVTFETSDNTIDLVVSAPNIVDDLTPVLGGGLDADEKFLSNLKEVSFHETYDAGDSGSSKAIDWQNGNQQTLRITNNACDLTYTAPDGPCTLRLILTGNGNLYTNIDPANDGNCEWLDASEPYGYGKTNAGIIGILNYVYDPDLTPNYIVSGISKDEGI